MAEDLFVVAFVLTGFCALLLISYGALRLAMLIDARMDSVGSDDK